MKPLFVPLKKKYFLKFKAGEQDCEIRPNNRRGWNVKNVYPGRLMTLSSGYGKHDRITKEIRSTMVSPDLRMEKLPHWHIDAVEEIYGKQESWLIAYVLVGRRCSGGYCELCPIEIQIKCGEDI